jgi:outer membrane protein TolC
MLEGSSRPPLKATLGGPTLAQASVGEEQSVAAQADDPLPPPSRVIDLATALAQAGADNPTIALADEAVRVSLAEQTQARALLFPTLDAGANLRLHRGAIQRTQGNIDANSIQALYWGAGAYATGAGTVAVPGVRLVSHLGDAYYAPQAAREKVVSSRFDAATVRQYLLMEVGVRYLALAEAQARQLAYRQSVADFKEIERLTRNHANAKQGRIADAERAHAETLLLQAEAQSAEEAIGVAAAELARLLDTDPGLPLRSADLTPPLLQIVDPRADLSALVEQAMAAHPELVARSADIAYQEIRVRQERVRPFLPVVAVGFSAGDFGGGGPATVPRITNFAARTDLDVVAVWTLQGLGVGNRGLQNVARSGLESALIERGRVADRIRREVTEAYAQVGARRHEIDLARSRIEISTRAYNEELLRTRNLKALPIEVLKSATQLADARQSLITAMSAYSQAQLQLSAALGNLAPLRPLP